MNFERWERTKDILEQALRLEPEKRQAYLDSSCRGDADLRGEVESLIKSHEEAGSQFLGQPPGYSATDPAAHSPFRGEDWEV